MAFDRKRTSVFRVARSHAGLWDVTEAGFDQPLASFGGANDARGHARELAQTKEGSRVIVFDENGTQMPAEGSAPMPPAASLVSWSSPLAS